MNWKPLLSGLGIGVSSLLVASCVRPPPLVSRTECWIPPPAAVTPPATATRSDTSPDKPLTLLELADMALRNSPATGQAWHEARAAAEQVRYAEGYFMPSLTAEANLARSTTSAHPANYDQNFMAYGPALELSYLICNFGGGRDAAVEQALQTVYAANFAFNQSIHDTLQGVQKAYYSLVSAQAAVEAALTNALDAKAILDAATDRRDAGLGVDLDVLQAKTAHAQARYTLAAAEGAMKSAQGLLAQAANLPADTPLAIAPPAASLPASLTDRDIHRILDQALSRRADLAALRASVAAGESSVRVARAARWPSLYATATASRDYYERYGLSNPDMASDDLAYTGGLSLKWNVFDGFQTLTSIRTAEAKAKALREQLRQAELAAGAEVWSYFQAYETALTKHGCSMQALESAALARDTAMESYRAGLKTILDILNAENQLVQARIQVITARQDVFVALVDLAHATGLIERATGSSANLFPSDNKTPIKEK